MIKTIINPCLDTDCYPLSSVDDQFVARSRGQEFSKIDLNHAYQQVMTESLRNYFTLNTHKGLFAVNGLLFGVSLAVPFPEIYGHYIERPKQRLLLLGRHLIAGTIPAEHFANFEASLRRLFKGVLVKVRKGSFRPCGQCSGGQHNDGKDRGSDAGSCAHRKTARPVISGAAGFWASQITMASLFPDCQHWQVRFTGYCVGNSHGVGTARAKSRLTNSRQHWPYHLSWYTTIQVSHRKWLVTCPSTAWVRYFLTSEDKLSFCDICLAHIDYSRKEVLPT